MNDTPDVSGVLPRAANLLTRIKSAGPNGLRLLDLANDTGIARSTVHRLLKDLADIGFVEQVEDKSYVLGPELYWLGLAAQPPLRNLPAIRNIAQQLANECGDIVYVAFRQGNGARYVLRVEGDFPIKSHVVNVGDLMPYTSSYSGLALLASLPDRVIDASIDAFTVYAPTTWVQEHTEIQSKMRKAVADIREQGWYVTDGVVMPGLSGMAAPIPNDEGLPIAAISITGIESRLPAERAEHLAPLLLATAAKIGQQLSA